MSSSGEHALNFSKASRPAARMPGGYSTRLLSLLFLAVHLVRGPLLTGVLVTGLLVESSFQGKDTFAQEQTGSRAFEDLRKEFSSLRNTDLEVERVGEWKELAARTEQFANHARVAREGAQAFFNASVLYERIYEKSNDSSDLRKALTTLTMLRKRYPADLLADDSLYREALLTLRLGHDESGARRLLHELITTFPKSDQSALAEVELQKLDRGGVITAPLERSADVTASATNDTVHARLLAHGNLPVVVIDPGHGGEDFGAVGKSGLLEKDVVLDVALTLERLLTEQGKARVVLTRRADQFVPLAVRTELANAQKAQLFLSLHSNSSPQGTASGFEFYRLDNSGDESSRLLAERENASAAQYGSGGEDLAFMLSDLIQSGKEGESSTVARLLEQHMLEVTARSYPELISHGVKKAPFYVLVGAHMPCVLAELLFINHPREGELLAQKEFRATLARGLFNGVVEYLASLKK